MFSISNNLIEQLLLSSFLTFLLIGGFFSLLVGIGLIFHSDLTLRLAEKANRWVSLRRKTRPLEIPRDCWPTILRYRYALSAFITIGAIYSIHVLTSSLNMTPEVASLSSSLHLPEQFVAWIIDSIKWILLGGCALGIIIGPMLVFALPTLSKLESLSNTWISTRNRSFAKEAQVMHTGLDNFVASFPYTSGWVIVVMSMIEMTLVGMQLR